MLKKIFAVVLFTLCLLFCYRAAISGLSGKAKDVGSVILSGVGQKGADLNNKVAGSKIDPHVVGGFLYDPARPQVLIGDIVYSIGDVCLGGRITGISSYSVTLESKGGQKEYRLGDSIRESQAVDALGAIKPQSAGNCTLISNAAIKDLLLEHDKNLAFFNLAFTKNVLGVKVPIKDARVIAAKMVELVQQQRLVLNQTFVPDKCQRYHNLTLKVLDIAEEGWKAAGQGDQDKSEVLFCRMLRVSQEAAIESFLLSGR